MVVFVAASLARALDELGEEVEKEHPRLELRLEVSGSQVACRKVAELNRRADLVAVADIKVINRILVPDWTGLVTPVATNEVVLAHLEHSRHTDVITRENWQEVLQRPGVRLGLVDPDLAPIGYRTLLVWQLAGLAKGANRLAERLRKRVPKGQLVPHEGELLGRLQARAIDYAFVYRSTAEDHNLKLVPLGDDHNLGSAAMAGRYARAGVRVRMTGGSAPVTVQGSPVIYAVTIPHEAPNQAGANIFRAALLSDQGRRVLERRGFRPLSADQGAKQ